MPINGMGRLIIGSKPIDGGNHIFDAVERESLLEAKPGSCVEHSTFYQRPRIQTG